MAGPLKHQLVARTAGALLGTILYRLAASLWARSSGEARRTVPWLRHAALALLAGAGAGTCWGHSVPRSLAPAPQRESGLLSAISKAIRFQEDAERPLSVTVRTLSGRSVRMANLKLHWPLASVVEQAAELLEMPKSDVQLCHGGRHFSPGEDGRSLRELGFGNGMELTCVRVRHPKVTAFLDEVRSMDKRAARWKAMFDFKREPIEVRRDRECVLAMVQHEGDSLQYADRDVRGDREVVLAAVRETGEAFKYAAEELRADREVVLAAVRHNGCYLRYASDARKADREVVLEAVRAEEEQPFVFYARRSAWALEYAPEALRADQEIVLAAVGNDAAAFALAAPSLKADREFVLSAVRISGLALESAADSLKADRTVCLAAVAQNGAALKHVAMGLRADRELVLAAVRQDGSMLEFAAPALQADREVVVAAMQQDKRSLKFAAAEARHGLGACSWPGGPGRD